MTLPPQRRRRRTLSFRLALALAVPLLLASAQPYALNQSRKPVKGLKVSKKPVPRPAPEQALAEMVDWSAVAGFMDEVAERHHFDRIELDSLMRQVRYVDAAVQLMKPAPPGKPKNWSAYRQRFIEPVRINAGLRFWSENAAALARAEAQFGVPAEIIVGIIGVETVYGRNTGGFRVLDALTTLAFAYPDSPNRAARMAFFRNELEQTLLFARQNEIDPLSLTGSYAGAVGLPQFMPSNILKFGLDFDGDGHVDLRNSATDAIGSVANFLIQHGWQRDDTRAPVVPAIVSPQRAWEPFLSQGLEAKFLPADLLAAGVSASMALPDNGAYGLVDLQNGADPSEYWLATNNFFAITQYNRSYFYAMSVIELGQAIRQSRGM